MGLDRNRVYRVKDYDTGLDGLYVYLDAVSAWTYISEGNIVGDNVLEDFIKEHLDAS